MALTDYRDLRLRGVSVVVCSAVRRGERASERGGEPERAGEHVEINLRHPLLSLSLPASSPSSCVAVPLPCCCCCRCQRPLSTYRCTCCVRCHGRGFVLVLGGSSVLLWRLLILVQLRYEEVTVGLTCTCRCGVYTRYGVGGYRYGVTNVTSGVTRV
jgi:hypothetical protein